jgi:hypothetical protein
MRSNKDGHKYTDETSGQDLADADDENFEFDFVSTTKQDSGAS